MQRLIHIVGLVSVSHIVANLYNVPYCNDQHATEPTDHHRHTVANTYCTNNSHTATDTPTHTYIVGCITHHENNVSTRKPYSTKHHYIPKSPIRKRHNKLVMGLSHIRLVFQVRFHRSCQWVLQIPPYRGRLTSLC